MENNKLKERLMKELKEVEKNCNNEANKNWEDDKIFNVEIEKISDDENEIIINLKIGRWENLIFYKIKCNLDNWKIIKKSDDDENNNLDDIMNYFIFPILFKKS